MVALHALSLYATKMFSLAGSSTVTVQSLSAAGEVYNFVTPNNRLLYQEKPLKNIPGNIVLKQRAPPVCPCRSVSLLLNICFCA